MTDRVDEATWRTAGGARYRSHWGMLGLGWLVYFAFGLISASLFPLVTPIRDDLGLSYGQFGLILGVWQLVYIGAAAPLGSLVDRIGTRRALLLGTLVVAASGLARSLAVNFATLLGAVALFGLGGPVVSIGLPKLIAEWFTGRSRGLASGIYATGSSFGNVAALALTNSVVLPATGSWRVTLQIYAGFTVLVAAAWLAFGRGRGTGPRSPSQEAAGRMRALIRNASVLPVIVIGFAAFLSSHGLRSWLPQIFESKGMTPADAGLLASVPTLVGIAGSIGIVRAASAGSRRTAIVAILAATGLSINAVAIGDGALMVAGIVVYGLCTGAFMPLLLNTLMEIPEVGSRAMGTAAGLYFSVGEVGGFLGPTVIGALTDVTGSFVTGLVSVAAVMGLMIVPASRLRVDRQQLAVE